MVSAKGTGPIFVGSEETDSLIIVDPETNRIVKHLKTSRQPCDIHFNANHSKLYVVAAGDDDAIDAIDVAKLEVVGRLANASGPTAIAIDDRRGRIYATNPEGSSVSVIDIHQNTVVHEIPTGAGLDGMLLSEDGRFAYMTDEVGDLVYLVDVVSGHVVQWAQDATAQLRHDAGRQGIVGSAGTLRRGRYHRPNEVRRWPARSSSCRPERSRPM